jgi:hypothetical protein
MTASLAIALLSIACFAWHGGAASALFESLKDRRVSRHAIEIVRCSETYLSSVFQNYIVFGILTRHEGRVANLRQTRDEMDASAV